MVRSERVEPERVVFERAEVDGRTHAPWILRAAIAPTPADDVPSAEIDSHADDRADRADRVVLTMSLHYGGSLWTGAALQRVLDHQVDRASRNLVELLSAEPTR